MDESRSLWNFDFLAERIRESSQNSLLRGALKRNLQKLVHIVTGYYCKLGKFSTTIVLNVSQLSKNPFAMSKENVQNLPYAIRLSVFYTQAPPGCTEKEAQVRVPPQHHVYWTAGFFCAVRELIALQKRERARQETFSPAGEPFSSIDSVCWCFGESCICAWSRGMPRGPDAERPSGAAGGREGGGGPTW